MRLGRTEVVDTFAEAFGMWGARVIITADTKSWARAAAQSMTGFATSVIRCKCEAAVECELPETDTPDRRPGISVLLFAMSEKDMSARLVERVGQSVMTCPTTACYDGLEGAPQRVPVGQRLRFFGDGHQIAKMIGDRRLWRIPVLEGEFVVDDAFGVQPTVGGGNLLMLGGTQRTALRAAVAAAEAMREVAGVFLPFPQGVVGAGSKVGSRYKGLIASTNEAYCPTLRGRVENSELPEGITSVYEVVVNGLDEAVLADAMRRGIRAAAERGVEQISAGNYGGTLGQYKFGLHELLNGD